jgi:hemin uptake protein HemP
LKLRLSLITICVRQMVTIPVQFGKALAVNTPENPSKSNPDEPLHPHPETLRLIRSEELLAGAHEVLIEHEGQTYRLRLTRSGKLILHK